MRIPSELRSGDSRSWIDDSTVDNNGNVIDSSTWALVYNIRGKKSLNLTASASGSGWQTAITAAQSALLEPGLYYWNAKATSGSSVFSISSGRMQILANLSTAGDDFDGRSQVMQDLDAVQAAIRAMIAGGAVQEYTINGRQLRKILLPDLLVLESRYKYLVSLELKASKIANGEGNPHNLYVRFKQ